MQFHLLRAFGNGPDEVGVHECSFIPRAFGNGTGIVLECMHTVTSPPGIRQHGGRVSDYMSMNAELDGLGLNEVPDNVGSADGGRFWGDGGVGREADGALPADFIDDFECEE